MTDLYHRAIGTRRARNFFLLTQYFMNGQSFTFQYFTVIYLKHNSRKSSISFASTTYIIGNKLLTGLLYLRHYHISPINISFRCPLNISSSVIINFYSVWPILMRLDHHNAYLSSNISNDNQTSNIQKFNFFTSN